MDQERIDDILKAKLRGYEPPMAIPPWSEMERRMALAQNEQGIAPCRRLNRRILLRYAAAAVLILFSLGIYRYGMNDLLRDADQVIALQEHGNLPVDGTGADFLQTAVAPGEPKNAVSEILKSAAKVSAVKSAKRMNLSHLVTDSHGFETNAAGTFADIADHRPSSSDEAPTKSNSSVTSSSPPAPGQRPVAATRSYFEMWAEENAAPSRKKRRPWIASAYTNAFASSDKGNNSTVMTGSDFRAALVETSTLNNSVERTGSDFTHKFPVSVGVNVRRYITDRFALETGITYSYLESTAYLPAEFEYRSKRKLHYLGVPLNVSYGFIQSKRWDVYAIGGGMAEFAVSARESTTIYSQNQASSRIDSSVPASGALWSLNAGAGVGYNILDNFGVYIEPGASYYFPNPNQPASYRTENPWSFSLRAGFRMKF